ELYEVDGKPYIAIDSEKWFRYQTYIPKAKRADDSGSRIPAPPSAREQRAEASDDEPDEEQRKTPTTTENQRKTPQNATSLSPSPSLSLSDDDDGAVRNGKRG